MVDTNCSNQLIVILMSFKIFKNPHIYTALIAAAIILIAATVLDSSKQGFLMIIYVVTATLQMLVARRLTKNKKQGCC